MHTLPQHTLHLLLCEQRQPPVTGKETSPSTFHLNQAVTRSSPAPLCHSVCNAGDPPPLLPVHAAFKNTVGCCTDSRTGSSSHTHTQTLILTRLSNRLEGRENKHLTDSWYSSALSAG
ncbi:hypothetical protein KOW79_009790 [Hemibagrus wyckioides]|uniref:Uncharacterized protein n=1 Tax=Hemibagrus wyckioides TaxID=337641 RepID=A0A9D3SP16_9TELE|nr:hypothetical protein KOW79_009790 [Hemibagrus wyckioides]